MDSPELPAHVATRRRDGRSVVLLHRSMAVIGEGHAEIRAARSTVILPLAVLALAALGGWLMVTRGGGLPLWSLVVVLLVMLVGVPFSVMGLVASVAGADVVADAEKGSITWQQGYLGMGIGTRELVPFAKIDHLAIEVEGEDHERWQGESDDLRQFAITLVKASGRRLTLARVPVSAANQADGMDRTLAVANAVAAIAGTTVRLPPGWELVTIDTDTGAEVLPPRAPRTGNAGNRRRGRKRRTED